MTPAPSTRRRWRGIQVGSITLVLLLAALIRTAQFRESLWVDELHTSWACLGTWADVWERALEGNQSPLYFWGLKVGCSLASPTEAMLRLPSLVAGMLLVLAAYVWTQQTWRCHVTAVTVSWVLALDPVSAFYAQEARPYAWLQLGTLVLLGLSWKWSEVRDSEPSVSRLALQWMACGAALFYLHYTSALCVGALWAGLLWRAWRDAMAKVRMRPILWAGAGWLGLVLPAAGLLLTIYGHRNSWTPYISRQLPSNWSTMLLTVILLPYAAVCLEWVVASRKRGCGDGVGQEPARLAEAEARRWRRVDRLLIWGVAGPLWVAWLATATGWIPLLSTRYLLGSWTLMLLLGTGNLARLKSRRLRYLTLTLILVLAVNHSQMIAQIRWDGRTLGDRREPWREWVAELNRRSSSAAAARRPARCVLLFPGLVEDKRLLEPEAESWLAEYCCFPLRGLYPYRGPVMALPTHRRLTQPQLAQVFEHPTLVSHGATWVVIRARPATAQRMIQWLENDLPNWSFDRLPDPRELDGRPSGSESHLHVWQGRMQTGN